MRVLTVNIGRPQVIPGGKPASKSGIFKKPVPHPVAVTSLGLEGDAVVDRRYHGGRDQAVYIYGQPDYDWWSERLGERLAPGTFGENLTIEGLESARLNVADRLRIGEELILEATAVRIPCGTLAARMGDAGFVKEFRDAERPGLYCRVIQEDRVRAGDPVELIPHTDPTVGLLEMYRDFFNPRLDEADIQRYLAAPVAERVREHKLKQLARLGR